MNRKGDSISFGNYLRIHRQKKGFSLKEIAEATKINVNSLLLLEKEELDKLPPDVIVRGFIKAYASFIGLDSSEVIRRYESYRESCSLPMKPISIDDRDTDTIPKLFRHFGLPVLCFFILVVSVIFLEKYFSKEKHFSRDIGVRSKTSVTKPETPPPKQVVQETELSGIENNLLSSLQKKQEKHRLNILTTQRTWIRIVIDDQETTEYLLNPKDKLTKEATDKFDLLIGNAAGIILIFDGRKLGPLGKPGQVVRITLPED